MKTQSSELMRIAVEKSRNEQRHIDWLKRSAMYRYADKDIDGEPCESHPDYNKWVKALENDPDYIAKVEKRLDIELGVDRLF